MQEQDNDEHVGLRDTCAACGGDHGGILFEGRALKGILTHFDIERLLEGALDHRQVVRLFTTRWLRGTKYGRVGLSGPASSWRTGTALSGWVTSSSGERPRAQRRRKSDKEADQARTLPVAGRRSENGRVSSTRCAMRRAVPYRRTTTAKSPSASGSWVCGMQALPTDLNADFSEPNLAAYLEKQVEAACPEGLLKPRPRLLP